MDHKPEKDNSQPPTWKPIGSEVVRCAAVYIGVIWLLTWPFWRGLVLSVPKAWISWVMLMVLSNFLFAIIFYRNYVIRSLGETIYPQKPERILGIFQAAGREIVVLFLAMIPIVLILFFCNLITISPVGLIFAVAMSLVRDEVGNKGKA